MDEFGGKNPWEFGVSAPPRNAAEVRNYLIKKETAKRTSRPLQPLGPPQQRDVVAETNAFLQRGMDQMFAAPASQPLGPQPAQPLLSQAEAIRSLHGESGMSPSEFLMSPEQREAARGRQQYMANAPEHFNNAVLRGTVGMATETLDSALTAGRIAAQDMVQGPSSVAQPTTGLEDHLRAKLAEQGITPENPDAAMIDDYLRRMGLSPLQGEAAQADPNAEQHAKSLATLNPQANPKLDQQLRDDAAMHAYHSDPWGTRAAADAMSEAWKPSEEAQRVMGGDTSIGEMLSSPATYLEMAPEQLGRMAIQIMIGNKVPAGFGVSGGVMEASSTYREQLDQLVASGMPVQEANKRAMASAGIVGVVSGVLEKYSGDVLLKAPVFKQAVKNAVLRKAGGVAGAASAEGVTETLQSAASQAVPILVNNGLFTDGASAMDALAQAIDNIDWQAAKKEGVLGAMVGGGVKAGATAVESGTPKVKPDPEPTPTREDAHEAIHAVQPRPHMEVPGNILDEGQLRAIYAPPEPDTVTVRDEPPAPEPQAAIPAPIDEQHEAVLAQLLDDGSVLPEEADAARRAIRSGDKGALADAIGPYAEQIDMRGQQAIRAPQTPPDAVVRAKVDDGTDQVAVAETGDTGQGQPAVTEVSQAQPPKSEKTPPKPAANRAEVRDSKRQYSSTQLDVPASIKPRIDALRQSIAPNDLAGKGYEDEPHITVKFGLDTEDAAAVEQVVAGMGPITLKLGKVSKFPPSESSGGAVPIKVDVLPEGDLLALRKRISDALPASGETFPDYKPHITLAYVKPEAADKYVGKTDMEGETVTVDALTFSGKDRSQTSIQLTTPAASESDDRANVPTPTPDQPRDETASPSGEDNRETASGEAKPAPDPRTTRLPLSKAIPLVAKTLGVTKAEARRQLEANKGTLSHSDGAGYDSAKVGEWMEKQGGSETQDDPGKTKPGVAPAEPVSPRGERGGKKKPVPASKIEDFGEKIGGAKKDTYVAAYKDAAKAAADVDVEAEPLSKSWPVPNYAKLLEEGTDPWLVAFARAARDEVGPKPRRSWHKKRWADQVATLRDFAFGIMEGKYDATALRHKAMTSGAMQVAARADLYEAVGHDKPLKGITLDAVSYSLLNGQKHDPPLKRWEVNQKSKATVWSNMPRTLAHGDTYKEAIAKFKERYDSLDLSTKKSGKTKFSVYSYRAPERTGYYVGKKVGKDYIDLKRFQSAKEATAYRDEHHDDLVAMLKRYKHIPAVRRATNDPRVGPDRRDGDVTPEQFMEAFGFRGVEFGNYVEGPRRQRDLNNAYDSLMDLANVIGVPPQALSLNGELGLAFGARGSGGMQAAAAHYEPDKVVVNLTKTEGAGSLAHEWWHGLDNYFGRMGGKGGFVTEGAEMGDVRPEMVEAFQAIRDSIENTDMRKRAWNLDRRRSNPYWSTGSEMSARAFEDYVITKLDEQGYVNDYLANIGNGKEFNDALAAIMEGGADEGWPYLMDAEKPGVLKAYDEFFKTVETRASTSPSGKPSVELFQAIRVTPSTQRPSPGASRDAELERHRAAASRVLGRDVGTLSVVKDVPDDVQPILDALTALGHTPVAFEGDSGVGGFAAGDTAYVNVDRGSLHEIRGSVAHEVSHFADPKHRTAVADWFRKNRPEVWNDAESLAARRDPSLSKDMLEEEAVAVLMEKHADDLSLWTGMAQDAPGVFKRIWAKVKRVLGKLVGKVDNRNPYLEQVRQLDALLRTASRGNAQSGTRFQITDPPAPSPDKKPDPADKDDRQMTTAAIRNAIANGTEEGTVGGVLMSLRDALDRVRAKAKAEGGRAALAEAKAVQKRVRAMVSGGEPGMDKMPSDVKARALAAFASAKTFKDLENASDRLQRIIDGYFKNKAVEGVKRNLKSIDMRTMDPVIREQLRGVLDTFTLKSPAKDSVKRALSLIEAGQRFAEEQRVVLDDEAIDFSEIPRAKIEAAQKILKQKELVRGGRLLRDMTLDEIQEISETIRMIAHLAATKGRLHAKNTKRNAEEAIAEGVQALNERGEKYAFDAAQRDENPTNTMGSDVAALMSSDQVNHRTRVKHLFGEGTAPQEVLVNALVNAEHDMAAWQRKAMDFAQSLMKRLGMDAARSSTKVKKGDDIDITLPEARRVVYEDSHGEKGNETLARTHLGKREPTLRVTTGEYAELMAHLMDPSTRAEILKNGSMGIVLSNRRASEPIKLTARDVEAIKRQAPRQVLELAKQVRAYMRDVIMPALNAEHTRLLGYDVAHNPDYYPRRRDRRFSKVDPQPEIVKYDQYEMRLSNQGVLKEREGSNMPVTVGDLFSTFFTHVNQTGAFITKEAANLDAIRFLNGIRHAVDRNIKRSGRVRKNLHDVIRHFRGDKGDLDPSHVDGLMRKIMPNIHIAKLAAKPNIALYQTVSLSTAAAYIKSKYLAKANLVPRRKLAKETRAEIDQWSPLLWQRRAGSVHQILTPETGGNPLRKFWGAETWWERTQETSMAMIQRMDTYAIDRIWRAAKLEGQDKGISGDALMEYTRDRAQEIVDKSQPTWDSTTLTPLMLSARKKISHKLLIMFSSQSSKNFNIMADAWFEWQRSDKTLRDRAELSRKVMLASAVNSFAVAAIGTIWWKGLLGAGDDDEGLIDAIIVDGFRRMTGNHMLSRDMVEIAESRFSGRKPRVSVIGGIYHNVGGTLGETVLGIMQYAADERYESGDKKHLPKAPDTFMRAFDNAIDAASDVAGIPIGGLRQVQLAIDTYLKSDERKVRDAKQKLLKAKANGEEYDPIQLKQLDRVIRKINATRKAAMEGEITPDEAEEAIESLTAGAADGLD